MASNPPGLIAFLTDLRERQGWTAVEIGHMLDLSKGMVYSYEQRRSELGTRSLGRLLKRFQGTSGETRLRQMIYEYLLYLSEKPPLGARGPRPHVDRSTPKRRRPAA